MTATTPQPNVLFIICDQLRADHLGFAGNGVVRTPNIDRLASQSVVFDQAFVSNPICMPNRSTIMTGMMPSTHGVIFNDRSLDPSLNTFVRQLRTNGWETTLIGKSHLQHGMSRETVQELGASPGRYSPYDEGWDTLENQERYASGEMIAPGDFYGFSHIELTIGHGAQVAGHHYLWALERGATPEVLAAGTDPESAIPGRSEHWWQVHPAPYSDEIHSTTFVTERSIDFITSADAGDKPWMVWCSYPDPHHPMAIPEPWFSRHSPLDMEVPPTFDDPGDDWAPHLHATRNREPAMRWNQYPRPFGPTREQLVEALAVTYGMIESIDDGVGQILDAVAAVGADDDTIVIFTTDHGDMMGDHGLIMKGAMHFGGMIRALLTIKVPGRTPTRTSSLAASIDLPHTVLDLCGVSEFQGMQGHSLVPVLDEPSTTVREGVLIEEDFPSEVFRGPTPARSRTLVCDNARFTRDSNRFETLYDLANDPGELRNLAVDRRHPKLRASMLERLTDEIIEATPSIRTEPGPA